MKDNKNKNRKITTTKTERKKQVFWQQKSDKKRVKNKNKVTDMETDKNNLKKKKDLCTKQT